MTLLDMFLVRATVAAVETLIPRMRRIRVVGDSLRGVARLPGQRIPGARGRCAVARLLDLGLLRRSAAGLMHIRPPCGPLVEAVLDGVTGQLDAIVQL